MSERNKLDYIGDRRLAAFSVFAIVACLVIGTYYGNVHARERKNAAASQQNHNIVECVSTLGFAHVMECSLEAVQAPYEKSKDYYDLKAQQDMAKWALLMLIVTGVGVVYVALTLSAAKRANEGFKVSAERQDRAYISVLQFSFVEATVTRPPGASMRIINSGNTPARKVYIWYKIGLRPAETLEPRDDVYSETERSRWDKTIGPQVAATVTGQLPDALTREHYLAMIEKKAALVMWGEVHYEDVFQQQHVTKFCYFYRGNPNEAGKPMSAWHTGNEAT